MIRCKRPGQAAMKIAPVTRKSPEQFEPDSTQRPNLTIAADNDPKPDDRFNSLLSEIRRLHAESERLRGRIQELEDLADTDAFLPIFNRRAFERELEREIALADRHRTPLSVVFIDLNGFKQINDLNARFKHFHFSVLLLKLGSVTMNTPFSFRFNWRLFVNRIADDIKNSTKHFFPNRY